VHLPLLKWPPHKISTLHAYNDLGCIRCDLGSSNIARIGESHLSTSANAKVQRKHGCRFDDLDGVMFSMLREGTLMFT